jgi:hypothetical protein
MIGYLWFGAMAYMDFKTRKVSRIMSIALAIITLIQFNAFHLLFDLSSIALFYLITTKIIFPIFKLNLQSNEIGKGDFWVFPSVLFMTGSLMVTILFYFTDMILQYSIKRSIPLLPVVLLQIIVFNIGLRWF